MGELSQVPEAAPEIGKLMPLLAKATTHRHYTQHLVLLETFCKQVIIDYKYMY